VSASASVQRRRLKYAATINDEALAEETDADYELQYVDIGNVDSSGTIHEIAAYRFEDAPSRARRRVRDGDVIISCVRTYLQAISPIRDPPDNLIGRVEEKRGGVQDRRRQKRAASFVAALAEWSIAPFLLPAHRTGRADFPHPALGRVSREGMRRGMRVGLGGTNAQSPKHILNGKLSVTRSSNLVPSAEKTTDGVVKMQRHIVPRLRHRTVGKVGRPAPHRAVQVTRHVVPRRLVAAPQSPTNVLPDGGDGLPGRPGTVVASAGSR